MAFSAWLVDEDGMTTVAVIRPELLAPGSDPIACSKLDLGFPEPRVVTQDRADSSGVDDFTIYHGSRKITADLKLFDTAETTKAQTLGILGSLNNASKRPYLYVNRPEWSSTRRLQLRADPLAFVSDRQAGAYFSVSMAWTCPSGVMEAADEASDQVIPIAGATGLPAPWHAPLAIPAGTSDNTVTIFNEGDIETPLIAKIFGRCADPTLLNRRTLGSSVQETQIKIDNVEIAAGSFLYIDTDAHIAAINQDLASSVYGDVDWGVSSWFTLYPGNNEIHFDASDIDENCVVYLYWRPRWLS